MNSFFFPFVLSRCFSGASGFRRAPCFGWNPQRKRCLLFSFFFFFFFVFFFIFSACLRILFFDNSLTISKGKQRLPHKNTFVCMQRNTLAAKTDFFQQQMWLCRRMIACERVLLLLQERRSLISAVLRGDKARGKRRLFFSFSLHLLPTTNQNSVRGRGCMRARARSSHSYTQSRTT